MNASEDNKTPSQVSPETPKKPEQPRSHILLWVAAAVFVVLSITVMLTVDYLYAPHAPKSQPAAPSLDD
jgi:uncharacterized membrane protein